jgi:hypothetical protein
MPEEYQRKSASIRSSMLSCARLAVSSLASIAAKARSGTRNASRALESRSKAAWALGFSETEEMTVEIAGAALKLVAMNEAWPGSTWKSVASYPSFKSGRSKSNRSISVPSGCVNVRSS